MSEHTKGKWEVYYSNDENTMVRCPDGNGCGIAILQANWTHKHKANAQRIVDCVNACGGIEDVSKWMKELHKFVAVVKNNENSCECDYEGWCLYCSASKLLRTFPPQKEADNEN